MPKNIDLPNSGLGPFQVWPASGRPPLFKGPMEVGTVYTFRCNSSAMLAYMPLYLDGNEVRIYCGNDAADADFDTVLDNGLPLLPGTMFPLGVKEGGMVAIATFATLAPGVTFWSAREAGE
jgi:hypothetical protein